MMVTCVEIKILRRVRAESSRPPPRHRRDACYFHTVVRCIRGRGHASGVADEIAEHGRGEQRRSVDDAEGHEQDAKQSGGHVLHDDLVLTKGTKQDLVEGGRRATVAYMWTLSSGFRAKEFTGSRRL